MISANICRNYLLLNEIMKDKKLAKVCAMDEIDRSFNYILMKEDNKVIGFLRYRKFTSEIAEAHIQILPSYWGQECVLEASHMSFKWLKDNTQFNKLFTNVPVSCTHVIGYLKRIGANICGMIKEGCMYDDKLTDLILYDLDLGKTNVLIP